MKPTDRLFPPDLAVGITQNVPWCSPSTSSAPHFNLLGVIDSFTFTSLTPFITFKYLFDTENLVSVGKRESGDTLGRDVAERAEHEAPVSVSVFPVH